MTLVVDASVVVAALVDSGDVGRWAEDVLPSDHLVAPHLLPVEAGNVLRRAARSGEIDADTGAIAHAELLGASVATLDARLAGAPGSPCDFVVWRV